ERRAAARILSRGFRDGVGTYMTAQRHSGVWVSDVPLSINEGAEGNTVLVLEIPAKLFRHYEWVQAELSYREALIPAAVLNPHGPPSPTTRTTGRAWRRSAPTTPSAAGGWSWRRRARTRGPGHEHDRPRVLGEYARHAAGVRAAGGPPAPADSLLPEEDGVEG